ncbi:MAG: Methionyl-tRNA formyltransferase [Peltula sp. TS41687]|nr:MAG: Methionyl-tRNA formyltransferase [Peltula sp. TS41687]
MLKGIQPPNPHGEPINLIIAVSFGLFVPPRILQTARHGGLNVHPSLLPEFRGAAPLHYTLLKGRTKTGVTVQTLHPEHFDHGRILAQTPLLDIPSPDTCTVKQLRDFLAPIGAELLIQSIRQRLFLPSDDKDDKVSREIQNQEQLSWAPKIRTEDSHINWQTWTADEILRRQRVLGPLWNLASSRTEGTLTLKRIIMQEIRVIRTPGFRQLPTGVPFLLKREKRRLLVQTCDEKVLEIPLIKVEGRPFKDAAGAAEKDHLFEEKSLATRLPKIKFNGALQ